MSGDRFLHLKIGVIARTEIARVLAGQWSGVVAAQHGPFSWVVIDGINVPQTHATITLRPVENSDGE